MASNKNKKFKKPRIQEIGEILRILRIDLGLSLRDVARLLNHKGPTRVLHNEVNGFPLPIWSKYTELYKDHPDLRGSKYSFIKLLDPDFLANGKLYKNLIAIYGREKLSQALHARTNAEIIVDLQEKAKAFEWRPEDIDCMRRRMGLLKSLALERRWKKKP